MLFTIPKRTPAELPGKHPYQQPQERQYHDLRLKKGRHWQRTYRCLSHGIRWHHVTLVGKQRKIHQQKSGLPSGKLTWQWKKDEQGIFKDVFSFDHVYLPLKCQLTGMYLFCSHSIVPGSLFRVPRIQTAKLPQSFTSEFHRVSDKPCCRSKSSNRTFCKTSSIATSGIWCSTWGYRSCSLSEPRNIYGFCGMKNTEALSHNSSAGPRRNALEDFATGPQIGKTVGTTRNMNGTLLETNIAPENTPFQKETSIPTIDFQALC